MKKFLSLALAIILSISLLIPSSAASAKGLAGVANDAVGKTNSALNLPSQDWCCYFVGYCINNSTVSSLAGEAISRVYSRNAMTLINWACSKKNIGPYHSFSTAHYNRLIAEYTNLSIISTTVDQFEPQEGDIIVFNWNGRGNSSSTFSHAGVVTGYNTSSKTVTYVDGNSAGDGSTYVKKHTANKNSNSIIGYIRLEKPVTYTVTFNANGGSVSQSTKTVVQGGTLDALPIPTRSGYTFICWSTAKEGAGSALTEDNYKWLTFDKDAILYAQWKLNCANHTYDADTCTNCGARLPYDNGLNESAAGTYQVSANVAYIRTGPYQVKDLVRTASQGEFVQVVGSVINSYNNTWMKTTDGYYVHADKLTLYSKTQDQSYYVILDNGSVCNRIKVTNGGTYGNLPTPSKDGYTFDGWFTSASGGVQVTASTTVSLTNNQTLYAHWTKIPVSTYMVTFDPAGGQCSISTMETNAEGKLSSLPVPTQDNCTFGGWRMRDGGSEPWKDVDTNTVFTKNTKVYASWIYGSCTVSFNANGGTVSKSSKIVTAGTVYGDLPTPVRNGYAFDGWYTKASGGIRMTSNTIVEDTADHTLYAHWTANPTQTTWGAWSAWSTTPCSASSTRQVETQQVKVSDAYTEYRYGLWRNTNNASWCPNYGASLSSSGGSWYESYSSWSKTRMYRDTGHNAFCAGNNHNHTHVAGYDSSGQAYWDIYSDDGTFTGWGRLYYYWEETRTIPAVYETQYRYRDLISA